MPEPEEPTVRQVIAFEELPMTTKFSRRAVVEWSDGSVGEAARWWGDEVLLTEGDLLGATEAAIQAKIHGRDVDWLKGE